MKTAVATIRRKERYVVDREGRKRGVVLSMRRYRQIMEDLHDLAVVAERREEATVSFDDIRRALKKDGLL